MNKALIYFTGVAIGLVATSLQAQEITPSPLSERAVKNTKSVERFQHTPSFGSYHILEGVSAVALPSGGFDIEGSVEMVAQRAMPLSRSVSEDVVLSEGRLVFNEITNDYGVVTGNITVLTGQGSIRTIASEFGLTVELADDAAGIGVLTAPQGADLLSLLAQLRESSLVRAAEIEVLEHLNKPHF